MCIPEMSRLPLLIVSKKYVPKVSRKIHLLPCAVGQHVRGLWFFSELVSQLSARLQRTQGCTGLPVGGASVQSRKREGGA